MSLFSLHCFYNFITVANMNTDGEELLVYLTDTVLNLTRTKHKLFFWAPLD